jgi:hypothetical protein
VIYTVASQPALTMKRISSLFNKLELSGRTFSNKLAVKTDQIAVLNTAVRRMTSVTGCSATLEIPLTGYMTGVGDKALVTQNTRSFVAFVTDAVRITAFGNIITCRVIVSEQSLIL